MKKLKKNLPGICLAVALGLMVLIVVGMIIMAAFGRPIADEYEFMLRVRENGVAGYIAEQYMTWSGRLAQLVGMGFAYVIFGNSLAQVVMPMVFLITFGAVWSWLIYEVIKLEKYKLVISAVCGYLVAGAIMITTVCLFDIYLWLDSAVVHLLGMIMIVYDVALGVYLFKNHDTTSKRKWLVILMLAIAFFGQTASEASMMITVGGSLVALICACAVKRWREYRKMALVLFIVLFAGGLVMVISPGLWARASVGEKGVLTIGELLFERPGLAYEKLFTEMMKPWKISLAVVTGLILGTLMKNRFNGKMLWAVVGGAIVTAFGLSYVSFVVYFYGTHGGGIESRAMSIAAMGLTVGVVIIVAFVHEYLLRVLSGKNMKFYMACYVVVGCVMCMVGTRGVLRIEKGYIGVLVERAAVIDKRDALISEYQNGEIDELVVPDVPVMIRNSDATDFTVNGYGAVQWFYTSFINYYGLPAEDVKVIGEDIKYSTPPDWYIEKERQVCTIASDVVLEKYYCGVLDK